MPKVALDKLRNESLNMTGIHKIIRQLEETLELDLGRYFVIGLQLFLIHAISIIFNIEKTHGFGKLSYLVLIAFFLHSILPLKFRRLFFLIVSIFGIFLLLGTTNSLWLIGISLIIVGVCRLPVLFKFRIGVLILLSVILAVFRANWIPNFVPSVVWPILGSMFMFRLIIYLYDVSHQKKTVPLLSTLSYFFILPNTFFPFFPLIDFTRFEQNYYNERSEKIYQRGINWMWHGILHLLLYRLIYYSFTLPMEDVVDAGSLTQFLVSNYLLYLRVSGQFHLVIGILCLFGYNLPRSHNHYYLASSFNDFWRRINIYWKDFMMKCFYYPMFMRLRKKGIGFTMALLLATIYVFACTWLLHPYQWFWLRGDYNLLAPESLFWLIIGTGVVLNSLVEYKFGKSAMHRKKGRSGSMIFVEVVRIVAMFIFFSVLWSLFTSPSMSQWLSLWSFTSEDNTSSLFRVFLLLILSVALLYTFFVVKEKSYISENRVFIFLKKYSTLNLSICMFTLLIFANYSYLEKDLDGFVKTLKSTRLNASDNQRLVAGYYEDLVNVNQFNELYHMTFNKPLGWVGVLGDAGAVQGSKYLGYELKPLIDVKYTGVKIKTNRWGMRDKNYNLEKPKNSVRIALIGGSETFGDCVKVEDIFESKLEIELNKIASNQGIEKYEILNFATGGYSPIRRYISLVHKATPFDPDFLFYMANSNEVEMLLNEGLSDFISKDITLPHNYLKRIVEEAGVKRSMFKSEVKKKLAPYANTILAWVYAEIVRESQKKGIEPILIYKPMASDIREGRDWTEMKRKRILQAAKKAGFKIINIWDTYKGYDFKDLIAVPWDGHSSPMAHTLLKDRIYEELLNPELGFPLNQL